VAGSTPCPFRRAKCRPHTVSGIDAATNMQEAANAIVDDDEVRPKAPLGCL